MATSESISDPRVLVAGMELPEDYELPSMEAVQNDLVTCEYVLIWQGDSKYSDTCDLVSKLRRMSTPLGNVQFDGNDLVEEFDNATKEAVIYYEILPDLFNYVFYIRCPDCQYSPAV